MNSIHLSNQSLFTERLDDVRQLRNKSLATKKHNHKILFDKRKRLHDACDHLKSEKLNKLKDVENRITTEIKTVQSRIEEQQQLKKCVVEQTSKCQDEITDAKFGLFKAEDSIAKARFRRSHLVDVSREMEEELQNKWTALMKCYNYFKQRLQCFMHIEDPQVPSCFIYFFTLVKTDTYFLRLTLKDGKWSFSDLTPDLPQHNALAQKLAETNDISGLLSCVAKLFREQNSKSQPQKRKKSSNLPINAF